MAITVAKAVSDIKGRIGGVYANDGTNWVSLGVVSDVEVSFEPVKAQADVAGRTKTLAYDVKVSYVMLQTANGAIASAAELANPSTANGWSIKVTDAPVSDPATEAAAALGIEFKNCLPNLTASLSYKGESSLMTVEFGGRVPSSQVEAFATTQVITFDI